MGMSTWQAKRQLAYLASKVAWPDAPQGLVYTGGAFVSEDLEGNFQLGASQMDGPTPKGGQDNTAGIAPFCRVRCVGQEWDRASPASRLERAKFELWTTAGGGAVPGSPTAAGFDSHGINQVTGGNRSTSQGQGKSQGRDVDELISRMAVAYGQMVDSEHALLGRCLQTQAMRKVNGSMVLKRVLEVEVLNALEADFYHAPISATFGVIGFATIGATSIVGPRPDRYDKRRLMLRYAAGSTPPAGPTDGTLGAYGAWGTTQIAFGIGSGTYGLSLFACYDETGSGSDERFSDPISGVVTK